MKDALFDDIFENGDGRNEVRRAEVLPPTNYNDNAPPFSDAESLRDRARRMEMARELQRAF